MGRCHGLPIGILEDEICAGSCGWRTRRFGDRAGAQGADQQRRDAKTLCVCARANCDILAAVEELKAKGSDSRRDLDFWGQIGVGAVALGCVSAAALGQVEIGIPCVIGGSASQGLLSFWEKQQQ